jgi:hypothetical protein
VTVTAPMAVPGGNAGRNGHPERLRSYELVAGLAASTAAVGRQRQSRDEPPRWDRTTKAAV